MAQRVLIAMALVNAPALLIADEPTTGLDVTVQAQILDLLREQARARGIGAVIITHDLGVVAHYCDEVAVMFAGQVVERGPVGRLFARPAHPDTRALIAATPERITLREKRPVGSPPNLHALPEGCLYRDRRPIAEAVCATPPPELPLAEGSALCHRAA